VKKIRRYEKEKMPKLFAISLTIILLVMAVVPMSRSQNTDSGECPADINRYEFLRYSGGQKILSVDAVVRADNNWSILLACLGGKTREELQAMGVVEVEL
jgi:hypothetical protein